MSTYQGSFVYTRKSTRIAAELPADFRIHLPNKDLERYSLNIKSLSGGGLSFLSPVPLPIGTQIEMTLYDLTVQIIFTAEVIWIEKVTDSKTKTHKCGLKFTRISDEDLAHIYRIVMSSLSKTNPAL